MHGWEGVRLTPGCQSSYPAASGQRQSRIRRAPPPTAPSPGEAAKSCRNTQIGKPLKIRRDFRKIKPLLNKIREVGVPQKVTLQWLKTVGSVTHPTVSQCSLVA